MQDNAMGPTTTSAGPATATTSDLVTTIPGERKHTFYVTLEGEAPATTLRYAPLAEPMRPGDELEAAREHRLRLRLARSVFGIAVTIGTYAITSATGGRPFLIASAVLVAGLAIVMRVSR